MIVDVVVAEDVVVEDVAGEPELLDPEFDPEFVPEVDPDELPGDVDEPAPPVDPELEPPANPPAPLDGAATRIGRLSVTVPVLAPEESVASIWNESVKAA